MSNKVKKKVWFFVCRKIGRYWKMSRFLFDFTS